jgi:hypothetical protein
MFGNQEPPETVDINIVGSLKEVGGNISGLSESEISPNCHIKTLGGDLLPAIWYPHSRIAKAERKAVSYDSVDFKGKDQKYSFLPSGWVFIENNWSPLVTRLLRVIGSDELAQTPDLLKRVSYHGSDLRVDEESIRNDGVKLLTSLGAASNPYYVVYLNTDKNGNLLLSETLNNWLVLDTKNVGYRPDGVGERIYGNALYFGGFWSCADRGSARKVDTAVCKVKNPPWPTRYFWAVIDDIVFNAEKGGSIKAGRIKILNEDQNQKIPDWVQPVKV